MRAMIIPVIGIMLTAAIAFAVQEKGAQNMELYGGNRGKVPFPHHQHQNVIGDCNHCHEVFPQEIGVIEKLKGEGKLQPKHVMNKLCTKCHRETKRSGQNSGPITCNQCHVRTD